MSAELQSAEESVTAFVDGKSTPSSALMRIEVVDPSTGQTRLRIPAGDDADAAGAVASARRAFDDGRWSDAPPSFRKQTLQRLADLIAEHAGTLDVLDAGEMGKPVAERFCNAAGAASYVRFYAEAIDKISGDVYGSDKHSLVAQRRVPIGVVAALVPWNFPTFNAVLKLAPALAAGNCVVLKPSELSTRSALFLARLALEAGLPPGVFNVVPGLGETVGRALGLHHDVDMVTFTGSTAVGKLMLQYAGQSNMKKVLAECGGKSPQVVFDDGVDLDAASAAIVGSLLLNQGQVCSVGSRLLVQQSIETALLEKIVARLSGVVIGNALDPRTTFGPLVSARQCARVMDFVSGAVSEGAELVVGGHRLLERAGGCFFEPTSCVVCLAMHALRARRSSDLCFR